MFLSVEVVISSAIWYVAWHSNIAIHEMGHYLTAVKTNNLRPELAGPAEQKTEARRCLAAGSGISRCS